MIHFYRLIAFALVVGSSLATAQPFAPSPGPTYATSPFLRKAGIEQRMGAQVPLDLEFHDESGRAVKLGQFLGKPVILALVYYSCPSLCNLVLNGVGRSTRNLAMLPGRDFEIVAVSFDPRETPEMAAAKKTTYMKDYAR